MGLQYRLRHVTPSEVGHDFFRSRTWPLHTGMWDMTHSLLNDDECLVIPNSQHVCIDICCILCTATPLHVWVHNCNTPCAMTPYWLMLLLILHKNGLAALLEAQFARFVYAFILDHRTPTPPHSEIDIIYKAWSATCSNPSCACELAPSCMWCDIFMRSIDGFVVFVTMCYVIHSLNFVWVEGLHKVWGLYRVQGYCRVQIWWYDSIVCVTWLFTQMPSLEAIRPRCLA